MEIKEEPFEEFIFTETRDLDMGMAGACEFPEICCNLCSETKLSLKLLQSHLQTDHAELGCDFKGLCDCPKGFDLSTKIINHLLFQLFAKSEEESYPNLKDNEKLPDPLPRQEYFDPPAISLDFLPQTQTTRAKSTSRKQSSRDFSYSQNVEGTEEKKIKCDLCPKLFKYKQGVQKHWTLEHNPENMFPCTKPDCNSRCKTLKNLHAHLRTHELPRQEGLGALQCGTCLKHFQTQKQFSLHLYTHREKFFSCDKCGAKFNNREQVKNHVLRHAGLFVKKSSHHKIICDECSTMVFSYKMKRHKLIHHTGNKPFKCNFEGCNAAFSDSRILSDHMNIHLKLKPYKCEYCPEAFRSGANLRLHRLRHTDPDRFRCEECQTSFVTKQALAKHNRRHTENPDIRPYACEYEGCGSTFKHKEHVRIHIRRTHEKSDDTFPCEFCSKCYNRKDALGKHLRKVHNVAKRKTRVFPVE